MFRSCAGSMSLLILSAGLAILLLQGAPGNAFELTLRRKPPGPEPVPRGQPHHIYKVPACPADALKLAVHAPPSLLAPSSILIVKRLYNHSTHCLILVRQTTFPAASHDISTVQANVSADTAWTPCSPGQFPIGHWTSPVIPSTSSVLRCIRPERHRQIMQRHTWQDPRYTSECALRLVLPLAGRQSHQDRVTAVWHGPGAALHLGAPAPTELLCCKVPPVPPAHLRWVFASCNKAARSSCTTCRSPV